MRHSRNWTPVSEYLAVKAVETGRAAHPVALDVSEYLAVKAVETGHKE